MPGPDVRRAVLVVVFVLSAAMAGAQASAGPAARVAAAAKSVPAAVTDSGGKEAAAPVADRESLLIGPGDLLRIKFVREPELDQRIRVLDSGAIVMALAGKVQVEGLTPAEAAARIQTRYRKAQLLLHPDVSVFVEQYATKSVAVLGEVAHPGNVQLDAPRGLIDVLSAAGGLTRHADRHITIQRGGKNGKRIEVFLPNEADRALNANVLVRPGDTVIVPKAGIVYVLGDVAHPGGYVMQNDSGLTVLQAIALAAGASKTASEKRVRLVRNVDGITQSIDLPLREMERGRDPDVPLQANDILYVPFSLAKNFSLGLANITAAASSAVIYATR